MTKEKAIEVLNDIVVLALNTNDLDADFQKEIIEMEELVRQSL